MALDKSIPVPKREVEKPFLMPVEDVFSITGRGTVARADRPGQDQGGRGSGDGGLRDGQEGGGHGVEMFRKLLDEGQAGDNVGLLLRGVEKTDVERGMVLAKPGSINAAHRVRCRGVRPDEGGGRPSHAVLQGVPAAVLPPDHGRDGDGGAAGGVEMVMPRRQHQDGDRAHHPDRDGGRPPLRDPRRRPHRRCGRGDQDPEVARHSCGQDSHPAESVRHALIDQARLTSCAPPKRPAPRSRDRSRCPPSGSCGPCSGARTSTRKAESSSSSRHTSADRHSGPRDPDGRRADEARSAGRRRCRDQSRVAPRGRNERTDRQKLGMARLFNEEGAHVPVTVIDVGRARSCR